MPRQFLCFVVASCTNAAANNIFIPLTAMPGSNSTLWEHWLGDSYAIDKDATVRLTPGYRKLTSTNA